MKDWKSIAAGLDLDIPESDLEKIVPVLDTLEAAFRPLVREIPLETEPAVIFHLPPEDLP
jgi:hypothetical protein